MRFSDVYRHPDVPGAGAAKRRKLVGMDKMHAVMGEFKRGTLRSGGGGQHVTNRKQAIAIALSEARRAGQKVKPRRGFAKLRKD